VRSALVEPLHKLAASWQEAVSGPRRRIGATGVGLVWVLALLLARFGTTRARVAAAVVMGASVAVAVGWAWVERRRLRGPEQIVRRLVRGIDREGADRAIRALSLVGPDGVARQGGTSADLAALHIERALARIPSGRVLERAAGAAGWVRTSAAVVGVSALGVALANAWSVLEGADVLVARRGVAPVTMGWLEASEVSARPPDYLHENERHELAFSSMLLPYGTTITVRGIPVRGGRRLFLSDGETELPFVEDGAGALIARWRLTQTTTLHVVARFGAVVIPEGDALSVESIPDEPPVVRLEGAPRQVMLVDENADLPLDYQASDDHGLREVRLVLRSGTREEGRVLARLDGDTKVDRGGHVLKLRDPFLLKSHAPVEVTIQAKDNDPLLGPKWGSSPPVTLLPPDVGEPQARRLEALRKVRDALVDSLAWRLANDAPAPATANAKKAFADGERAQVDADDALLTNTLAASFGGVRVPRRLHAMLVAQEQKTRKAVDAEVRTPTAATHAEAVRTTERFVLVVDAIIRGLGVHDSRDAARELADVADDLALGALDVQNGTDRDTHSRAVIRMDAAGLVLTGGGRAMRRLGALGLDLGEIVDADLWRVKRAREGADFVHAELAARDLAARLREPDPSFGSEGHGRAGGESGGGRGTPGEDGEGAGDEVAQAQQEAEQDLERLAQDHAAAMSDVERALEEATSEDEKRELRDEAKRHAEAVREAARELPTVGMGSDSWTSKGAAARELAEQMARSMEELHPDDAVQTGHGAAGALDEAKKMLQKGSWMEDPNGDGSRKVEDARRRLEAETKWAEDEREAMRKRAAERARKQLEESAGEEGKMADRARELGRKGRERGSLPDETLESIEQAENAARQAAEALQRGDAERGLDRQREAQRHLEAAGQLLGGSEEDGESPSSSTNDGDGKQPSKEPVNIPGKGKHKGPEEFRQRVLRGLSQPSSNGLKDAVHRYAEGLLR
jgi:hypothetical protein